ncbi:MAG: HlyU family transcriptional regulator [Hyphomicrobiaceae bacterium]
MSFWKKLFGSGGGGGDSGGAPVRSLEHNGFTIEARPYPEGGQYQVAGSITKQVGEIRKEHRFIRADRFPTIEEAADFALMKGRQIVDQQGDRIFD